MPQTKILVDSNTYFRLAKCIHPLLFREFGDQQYCLYVLKELDEEYAANSRLKSKFPWVNDPDLTDNRSHYLTVGRKQKKLIEQTFDYIWDHVQTVQKGPSRIDVLYLAHAYVLDLTVVTDDRDMLAVAEVFGIRTRKTLSLMRLMCDCGHIDAAKVREIVEFWRYMGDRPADMEQDYRRLFQDVDSG